MVISVLAFALALPVAAVAQFVVAPTPKPVPPKPATPSPDTSKTPADTDVTTVVTITAEKPLIEHKIDRDIYDVKQDPQAATGSAADVLNNVPSVTVDDDGTVSLRGNSNPQVYINGKKSAQMEGDNKGFTLQSLAADDIDTIEVIATPGAAYGADTAGGIINIVMKRGRTLKPQTSMNVTVGDQGRAGIGLRANRTFGKLKLNGGLTLNNGAGGNGRGGGGGGSGGSSPKVETYSERSTFDPIMGDMIRKDVTRSVSKSSNKSLSANLGAEYDLTDSDDITSELNYSRRTSASTARRQTQSYSGAQAMTSDTTRLSTSSAPSETLDARLVYNHRGEVGSTENFKMQLSHSGSLNRGLTVTQTLSSLPPTPDSFTTRFSKTKNVVDEFSGDWSHPLGDYDQTQQQIQLGWSLQNTVSDSYNYQSLALPAPVNPPESPRSNATKQFNNNQLLSAVYGTYQRQIGALAIQAGLRVENLHQSVESYNPGLSTPPSKSTHDSVNYSPSLFVTYKLADNDQLKFIYSQKIQRPTGRQLDPLIVLSEDGLSASSGNASLRDSKTDKFSLNYNHSTSLLDLSGSLYYNDTTGAIEQVISFLPNMPSVLLTSYANAGTTQNSGFSGNISFHTSDRKINLNFSPNYGYTTTRFLDPTTRLPVTAKGPNSSANLRVSYRATPTNSYTMGLQYRGRSVGLESYRTATNTLNASWTHQIIPNKAVLTVNASNLLIGPVSKSYTNSLVAQGFSQRVNDSPTVMASLRYTFGTVMPRQRDGASRGPRQDGERPSGRFGRRDPNTGGPD